MKKSIPPPEGIEEGDTLKANLVEIKKETSQWKDDKTGESKEQFEINFELENGFKGRTWIAYYETPGDKSALGKFTLTLERMTKREINDIQGFLTEFKAYGKFFVKVKGFRETESGDSYPNFALVTDKLPSIQSKMSQSEPTKTIEQDPKLILEPYKEAIGMGLPLNESDWNNLSMTDRVTLFREKYVKEEHGLFFFTERAQELFKNAV